jgi:hypothetical protein
LKTYCVELDNPSEENIGELTNIMNKLQDQMVKYTEEEANKLNISFGCATDIIYLRTRSMWTQEKEDYLIHCYKNNLPSPNIIEDFEVPKENQ